MMGTVVAYRIDHLPHVMCDATNIIYWVKKVSYFHCASYEMLTTPSIAEGCVCVEEGGDEVNSCPRLQSGPAV